MITITEKAAERVKALAGQRPELGDPGLRVKIAGGGCSGFQYRLDIEDGPEEGDSRLRHRHRVRHRAAGLDEDVIRLISAKKGEPEWMLEWRLKAYRHWLEMKEPQLAEGHYPPDRLPGDLLLLGPRRRRTEPKSLDEVDPELLETYEKLGIPLEEQKRWPGVAVDAVFDSVSVATTFKEKLAEAGVIFCSISEAVQEHPELVKKYLGSVVPYTDNFYAALNSAVFTDGSFVYVPEGRALPDGAQHLLPHQRRQHRPVRAHADRRRRGQLRQLPRGLHRADARREPAARGGGRAGRHGGRQIKYSTVQNWYPGDEDGKGGIYNFVTKRGTVRGERARRSPGPRWRPARPSPGSTRAASCKGDDSVGEFYSVALTNNRQQADTGTKMIHLGKNTKQHHRQQGHLRRQRPEHLPRSGAIGEGRRERPQHTQCDSCCIGDRCGAHTFPYIEVRTRAPDRARGDHVEDRRRPALLLPPAGLSRPRTPSP
jgi:Fe-S cluster assembly protein SufB